MLKLPLSESNGLPDTTSKQKKSRQILSGIAHKFRDTAAFKLWSKFPVLVHNVVHHKKLSCSEKASAASEKAVKFACNEKLVADGAIKLASNGKFLMAFHKAESDSLCASEKDRAYSGISKLAAAAGEARFAFAALEKILEMHVKDKACAEAAIELADSGKVALALEAVKLMFQAELRMRAYENIHLLSGEANLDNQGTDVKAWKLALDVAYAGPIHHHRRAHEFITLITNTQLHADTLLVIESILIKARNQAKD